VNQAIVEILCACGHRFAVTDEGHGTPHACPACQVRNVLPRTESVGAIAGSGTKTVVRSTAVLTSKGRDSAELPAGTEFGPYRVARRIGKGGMGSVYEAHDQDTNARVALKVLSPDLATRSDFVTRFHRESRALAELDHPRIARVIFSGASEGVPFFAMEFIEGGNLEQFIELNGTLNPERAIQLMTQAASGLQIASERGIIHRDIKPTNLLLDADGGLRIVDFGLAKSVGSDSRLTVTGAVVGTPFYLSPEQGLGKPVDQRSDIYSLGATFYHLLAGNPPFDADSPVSIIMRHVNDPPEPLSRRSAAVPEPLARIVMRCMAKDPARRYQDYDDLLEDLEAARTGEPVSAPPEAMSIRKGGPSVVVMDELEDGARVLRRASRLRRAWAIGVDLMSVGLITLIVSVPLQGLVPLSLAPLLSVLYFAWGDAIGGYTVGKRFMRLRVARDDGGSPGIRGGLARGVCLVPIALIPFLSDSSLQELMSARLNPDLVRKGLLSLVLLDIGAAFLSPRRRTFHDVLSGTSVFREDRIRKKNKRKSRKRARDNGPPLGEVRPVSPLMAALLSLIPGLGQLANRDRIKAVAIFVAFLVSYSLENGAHWLVLLLSVGEAWWTARKRTDAFEARA